MGQLVSRRSYACAAMTWNVNEQRPEDSAAFTALRDAAADAHVVAVGLQARLLSKLCDQFSRCSL